MKKPLVFKGLFLSQCFFADLAIFFTHVSRCQSGGRRSPLSQEYAVVDLHPSAAIICPAVNCRIAVSNASSVMAAV